MDPIPLNAVRAAAADVAADTSGTAVATPVADIAADARAAALVDAAADTAVVATDAAADTAVVAADAQAAACADAAADDVAAVDSADDLYRRACRVTANVASTSPALPAASGFETSSQGMVAVGPVRALVELLHANETTLQFG